jgi:hypothetical protein
VLQTSEPTVRLWRGRFAEAGIPGLEEDAHGRGRLATYDQRTINRIVSVTLGGRPRARPTGAAPRWQIGWASVRPRR